MLLKDIFEKTSRFYFYVKAPKNFIFNSYITFVYNLQIIDSLTEKLEVREARLLSVSKEKAHLEETCDNLKE